MYLRVIALDTIPIQPSGMDRRYVGAGAGLLTLAIVLATGGPLALGVSLKTGSLSGSLSGSGSTDGRVVGCYTSGVEGQLVTDPDAGTAIIDNMGGHRAAVTWPIGYTGRRSWSEVEVLDRSGNVVVRTGTLVNLPGGYWTDGSFLACGSVIPNY
jgi:hypothetical protein